MAQGFPLFRRHFTVMRTGVSPRLNFTGRRSISWVHKQYKMQTNLMQSECLYRLDLPICIRLIKLFKDDFFKDLKRLIRKYQTIKKSLSPIKEIQLPCMYALCQESQIVSVAITDNVKINHIYTFPEYRNMGYASTLLNMLVRLGVRIGFDFYSPVSKEVENLFIHNDWKALTDKENPDKTLDYCHQLFYDRVKKCYPETTVYYTMTAISVLNNIKMPEKMIREIIKKMPS